MPAEIPRLSLRNVLSRLRWMRSPGPALATQPLCKAADRAALNGARGLCVIPRFRRRRNRCIGQQYSDCWRERSLIVIVTTRARWATGDGGITCDLAVLRAVLDSDLSARRKAPRQSCTPHRRVPLSSRTLGAGKGRAQGGNALVRDPPSQRLH